MDVAQKKKIKLRKMAKVAIEFEELQIYINGMIN